MPKRYYAVRKGRKTGIFETWTECEESIKGYPGAEYKSFANREDAELYLKDIDQIEKYKNILNEENQVIAYVDGSYDKSLNKCAFGCVILTKDNEEQKFSSVVTNKEIVDLHNIAGEIEGVKFAVKWAYENGYEKIIICHDYEGLSKWYYGEWQANSKFVKDYIEFMRSYSDFIKIEFKKVTAHSGDKYNELADLLAREALQSNSKMKTGDSWITASSIEEKDFNAIIELLTEDFSALRLEKSDKSAGIVKYVLTLEEEKLVVHYYPSKRKIVIQGKPKLLFSSMLGYISEIVSPEDLHQIYSTCVNIELDKNEVEKEFADDYLINAKNELPQKLAQTLRQAIYNLHIEGDMFDYTFIAFPALRALEGFIKHVLKNFGIECYNNTFENIFECKGNGRYQLNKFCCNTIKNKDIISKLNKMYNFYRENRHTLFHWSTFKDEIDDSRVIDRIDESKNLIRTVLNFINEFYA